MNSAFRRRAAASPSRRWLPRRLSRHLLLGRRGERAAARYLKRESFRLVARNYRCPFGEIDLIARRERLLLFVEVKTRDADEPLDPLRAVQLAQWGRIERAARYFIQRRRLHDYSFRFDLLLLTWKGRGEPIIEHFENAWRARCT